MNRTPDGSSVFCSRLVNSLTPHGIETLLAHFAAIGLDGSGEKEVIHEAWPRRPNSGGLAAGAL